MTRRPLRKNWWLWGIAGAGVILAAVWVAQSFMAPPQTPTKAVVTPLNQTPQVITTSDALTRYVTSLTTGKVVTVRESDVFYVKDIDWNNEELVAIKFMLLAAKSVMAAGIEKVDGKSSYVIDVLDANPCTPHTANDTMRLVFLKQPSGAPVLPVILRTTPNMATCDGIR